MPNEDKLNRYLGSLPGTEDGIVNLLTKEGIKGDRAASCNCPIANLLRQNGFKDVKVDRRVVAVDGRPCEWLPLHIADFIDKFDRGLYPELEETS